MNVSLDKELKPSHSIATELVTPEMAKSLLNIADNSGFKNRNCTQRRIDFLANIIETGQWIDSNDCICVDNQGVLINGYHRMHAIIQSNQPVWATLKRGMERVTFQAMDTGKKRSTADVLTIDGVKNAGLVARSIKLLILYEAFGIEVFKVRNNELNMISNAEVIHAFNENLAMGESCAFIKSLNQVNRLMAPGFLAFTHYLFKYCKNHDPDNVDLFFMKLNTDGIADSNETPYLLRKKLLDDRLHKGGIQLTNVAKHLLFIKCWNYYIIGSKLTMLRFNRDESFPDFK